MTVKTTRRDVVICITRLAQPCCVHTPKSCGRFRKNRQDEKENEAPTHFGGKFFPGEKRPAQRAARLNGKAPVVRLTDWEDLLLTPRVRSKADRHAARRDLSKTEGWNNEEPEAPRTPPPAVRKTVEKKTTTMRQYPVSERLFDDHPELANDNKLTGTPQRPVMDPRIACLRPPRPSARPEQPSQTLSSHSQPQQYSESTVPAGYQTFTQPQAGAYSAREPPPLRRKPDFLPAYAQTHAPLVSVEDVRVADSYLNLSPQSPPVAGSTQHHTSSPAATPLRLPPRPGILRDYVPMERRYNNVPSTPLQQLGPPAGPPDNLPPRPISRDNVVKVEKSSGEKSRPVSSSLSDAPVSGRRAPATSLLPRSVSEPVGDLAPKKTRPRSLFCWPVKRKS